MAKKKFRNRHRLSKKEVKVAEEEMIGNIGFSPFSSDAKIDVAQANDWTVLIWDDEIVGVYLNDRLFPTLKGLLRSAPEEKYVTVDMGAIRHVVNGANVMAPGIVDADGKIEVGDIVWIRDEKNRKPLAIGIALITGSEMIENKEGRAVKNLHYVGDEIWGLG